MLHPKGEECDLKMGEVGEGDMRSQLGRISGDPSAVLVNSDKGDASEMPLQKG